MQDQANPYAPPKAVVGEVVDDAALLASRGSRLGAAVLDGVIGLLLFSPVIVAVGFDLSAYASTDALTAAMLGSAGIVTLLLSLAWIAVTIMLVQKNGQTIAKKMLGIKVVRSDGSKASLGRIFWLRNVVNALPAMIPVIGKLYQLIDPLFIFGAKQQCVHDKIADTIVVRA